MGCESCLNSAPFSRRDQILDHPSHSHGVETIFDFFDEDEAALRSFFDFTDHAKHRGLAGTKMEFRISDLSVASDVE